ncbi:MAG: DUF4012 domain-containing protein [Patescibacteria group bacterium]|nr:DUF4012 domain-containing protein [Patescibacteria group bacterium]
MDIIPNKKSNLLYQKGDRKIKGIIDLRCFGEKKKTVKIKKSKNKIVSEIIRKKGEKLVDRKNNRWFHSGKDSPLERSKGCVNVELKHKPFAKKLREIKAAIKPVKTDFLISQHPNFLISKKYSTKKIAKQKTNRFAFYFKPSLLFQKSFACFVFVSFFISSIVFAMSFLQGEFEQKERVLGVSTEAYDYLKMAGRSASDYNFDESADNFNSATLNFTASKKMIDEFGLGIAGITNSLPINTPISTAKNLAEAGERISVVGKSATELIEKISQLDKDNFSLSSVLEFQTNIDLMALNLKSAEKNLANVNINYIPENLRWKLEIAQSQLPVIANNFENLSSDFPVMAKMLGDNRSQKYLLIFENNNEIRAGGGFIGSYGILDLENGKIKNLFIDGIFNPDGQLNEKVVPPMPIQKISATWSMHDANWFADFPTSAKKIALFYEKTGGATVDGIIAITPNVTKKMLAITGPIEMPEYNTVISKENFLVETQLQVEELYNRQENKPKKILADLAPKIISELFNTENLNALKKIERYFKIVDLVEESFREKHLIFYHRDSEIEKMIIKRGWGGQVLNSSGDYLSVVNSNINGYKTDAVIDEQITHSAEILSDGSIIDTVRIIRKHTGGESDYDWYNRVNSNYMRVYVPKGSILLDAQGHTLQNYEPPIDYNDFGIDPDIAKIESSIKVDPETGTHIFEEAGKTVFGNWVYVSPGETVKVMYKYQLPYKIDFDNFTKPADKYSILIQKQLGSAGSKFSGSIKLPAGWSTIWNSPDLNFKNENENEIETDLRINRIYGTVFEREMDE